MPTPQNTPTSAHDQRAHASMDAAQEGDWRSFFKTSSNIDLNDEALFHGNHDGKIALIAKDPPLFEAAINAALEHKSWDFIYEVINSEYAAACPPSKLNSSHQFKNHIFIENRPLSPQENAKILLWRSILVANPWHTTTLSDEEHREWAALARAVMRNLAISTTPSNEFSNPGHLIHVVDAVNESIRASSHEKEPAPRLSTATAGTLPDNLVARQTRPEVTLAAVCLIEALSRSTAPVSLTEGALADLDLARLSSQPAVREEFFGGIYRSLSPTKAVSFLHHIATDETACPDLRLRVSAVPYLLSLSERPVSTLLAVLRDANHGEIRAIAMRALSEELKFPLVGKPRQGVRECGPEGGAIVTGLLSGLDKMHSSMNEVVLFPDLARRWILACSAAGVAHGINANALHSYNTNNGGPLSGSRVDFALEPLDPLSPIGIANALRRWARV